MGSGVITRISGQPQDVAVIRAGVPVARPRVLEVLCEGDLVQAKAPSSVALAIDGLGPVTVKPDGQYLVGHRAGSASVASNAYEALSAHVLKDMKRQPWDVRLRAAGPVLAFGVSSLPQGGQQLTAGRRDILVRALGGVGHYEVTLVDATGAAVAHGGDKTENVLLKAVDLKPGAYFIQLSDASGAKQTAMIKAVEASPPIAGDPSFADLEVRAAVQAAELARTSPAWVFESQQILNAAPAHELDRNSVYRLIESYSEGDAP